MDPDELAPAHRRLEPHRQSAEAPLSQLLHRGLRGLLARVCFGPKRLAEALRNRARLLARLGRNRWLLPHQGLVAELAQLRLPFTTWLNRRRESPRIYVELGAAQIGALRRMVPEEVEATLAAAEVILEHRFDLLGSGPFVPRDPDRHPWPSGYSPIDWFLDPVRGLRFPKDVPHREWNLIEMRPENADVKYPWELARCQHWPTLAQAWKLTADKRFAHEIIAELQDFMEENPVGVGINWTCTMDVAIRAANWTISLALILDCPAIRPGHFHRAYEALFDHGRFIFENLENLYEVTSNHFLSNVVGLHFLATEFHDLRQAAKWMEFCRKALEREIDIQVLPDGADFESSVPYHRLVAELFLASARLDEMHARSFSEEFKGKLERMVDYLVGVLRPDGLMPQIGDADDGRLHILTSYGQWNPQDPRHLLAAAGGFWGRSDWLRLAGRPGLWESAWWGFAPIEVDAASAPPNTSRLFPDAGVMVVRQDGDYLAVTNGRVGTRGFGNHKHNDLLGFELHIAGIPLFVDPGSFVYTCDFAARNALRSTAAHNTVMVDGIEQNEFNPDWLFRMFEKAQPQLLAFSDTEESVTYQGRHDGYARLDEPVIHERTFVFLKAQRTLVIRDRFTGPGRHRLRWRFHAAPGISLTPSLPLAPGNASSFRLSSKTSAFGLRAPPELDSRFDSCWYSPSYGVRRPIEVLDLSADIKIDGEKEWLFALGPEATILSLDISQLRFPEAGRVSDRAGFDAAFTQDRGAERG